MTTSVDHVASWMIANDPDDDRRLRARTVRVCRWLASSTLVAVCAAPRWAITVCVVGWFLMVVTVTGTIEGAAQAWDVTLVGDPYDVARTFVPAWLWALPVPGWLAQVARCEASRWLRAR